MRSFSSREDTSVLDEPFYAHYLKETGIAHRGREEVIAAYEADWREVIAFIAGPIPDGKSIWYQKHMAHHMLPEIDVRQLIESDALTHAFLIRDSAEVIGSYTKVHAEMTLAETGLPYQVDLFERVRKRTGVIPPIIDARDLLINPPSVLRRLCNAIGIAYTKQMLTWPAGPHPSDGNWAPHWYGNVYNSTRFEKYEARSATVAPNLMPVLKEARKLYDQLAAHKL